MVAILQRLKIDNGPFQKWNRILGMSLFKNSFTRMLRLSNAFYEEGSWIFKSVKVHSMHTENMETLNICTVRIQYSNYYNCFFDTLIFGHFSNFRNFLIFEKFLFFDTEVKSLKNFPRSMFSGKKTPKLILNEVVKTQLGDLTRSLSLFYGLIIPLMLISPLKYHR